LLADLSRLKIETTDLSEIDAARLTSGMPLRVSFDAFPGQDIDGTVGRIALKSSPGSGVNYILEVEAGALPEGLRWGMSAFVVVQAP
jgi:HlyD family secretion protein